MRIELNDKYAVETDTLNIILKEKKIKTDKSKDEGGDYETNIGYYANFNQLAKSMIEKEILKSNAKSFQEINDLILKTAKEIENGIKKVI